MTLDTPHSTLDPPHSDALDDILHSTFRYYYNSSTLHFCPHHFTLATLETFGWTPHTLSHSALYYFTFPQLQENRTLHWHGLLHMYAPHSYTLINPHVSDIFTTFTTLHLRIFTFQCPCTTLHLCDPCPCNWNGTSTCTSFRVFQPLRFCTPTYRVLWAKRSMS